jgi:hypothetical protein
MGQARPFYRTTVSMGDAIETAVHDRISVARAMHNLIQHAEWQASTIGFEAECFEALEGGDIVIYWQATSRHMRELQYRVACGPGSVVVAAAIKGGKQ